MSWERENQSIPLTTLPQENWDLWLNQKLHDNFIWEEPDTPILGFNSKNLPDKKFLLSILMFLNKDHLFFKVGYIFVKEELKDKPIHPSLIDDEFIHDLPIKY